MVVLLAVRYSIDGSLRDLGAHERWVQQYGEGRQFDAQKFFVDASGSLDVWRQCPGMFWR